MLGLTQLLRRAVQMNPTGTATICGERRQGWAQAQERVARCAGALRALGLGPGERVGILALNGDRYFEVLFGTSWAGAVFVPVNTRLAPPEIAFWLGDPGCTVLVVDDAFAPLVPRLRAELPALREVVFIGDGPVPADTHGYEALLAAAPPAPDAAGQGDDVAGIFYTGGTTGRSKGVMLSHANLVLNTAFSLTAIPGEAQPVYIHAAPMFHIADAILTLIMTSKAAAQVFMPRFDPVAFMQLVAAHRVTDVLLVPTMVNMVVNHPEAAQHDLSSLRYIAYGASPMPEAVIRRAMEVLPQVRFSQAYGQTEAAPVITVLPPDQHGADPVQVRRMRSAGRAILGWEVQIQDDEGREVPRGTVGEVCARGPCVMRGYWNQPELTAQALRGGWLHTGDGGVMDEEGYITIVDRMKDMIISGGENVYSSEVEQAVYAHPAVAECAVIGVPDEKWGERVHAVVRLKPGTALDEAALMAHCHGLIAGFKCPRSISFRDDPLPLSGAGKILKTELRKPFWEGRSKQVA